MEHEIIGHTNKALKVLKDHEKSIWEKIKEIGIEILIIVFAVTFAAFIERTRETSKEKGEAKEFLIGVKGDLKDEVTELQSSKNAMDSLRKSYTYLVTLKQAAIDSIIQTNKPGNFNIPKFGTSVTNGRYDGFKASGRIQTIENDSVRNQLLKLYEEDMPDVGFTERVFNANQIRLEDYLITSADDMADGMSGVMKTLTTQKCKMIVTFSLSYADAVSRSLDKALAHAKKLQRELEEEYK